MAIANPLVRQPDIEAGLRQAGVETGSVALVHSSLSSMGRVEGGAAAVVTALRAVLGPGGTLAMPALCQRDKERRFETWDIAHSPSDVGIITETLRLMPESIRSDHATHSVAAIGPRAGELTRDHVHADGRPSPWGPAAFGHGSPWEKLHAWNARLVFLGVTLSCNTTCHYVQSLLVERLLEAAGPRRAELEADVQGWGREGVWPKFWFAAMETALHDQGLMCYGQIGPATVRSALAGPMVAAVLDDLGQHPEKLPGEFCAWARRCELRRARKHAKSE